MHFQLLVLRKILAVCIITLPVPFEFAALNTSSNYGLGKVWYSFLKDFLELFRDFFAAQPLRVSFLYRLLMTLHGGPFVKSLLRRRAKEVKAIKAVLNCQSWVEN